MSGIEMSLEGDGLKALQRKIKQMPNSRTLTRELNKGLREGAKHLPAAAQQAARESLPRRGGLNERVAGHPVKLVVSSSQSSAGIKVRFKGVSSRKEQAGLLRHPVFADASRPKSEWVWKPQQVKPEWFTAAMRAKAPDVRPALLKAMERVARKIADA